MTIALRHGLRFTIHGKPMVLVRLLPGDVWQAEEERTQRLFEIRNSELLNKYRSGDLSFTGITTTREDPPVADVGIPPEESWNLAKVRRLYVKAIKALPATRDVIAPVIQETWDKLQLPSRKPHVATVLRWRKKLLSAQEDVRSLITRNDRKGNRKSRFPEDTENIARASIEAKYLTRERLPLSEAIADAIADTRRENALRPKQSQLPLPTRRLISRLLKDLPAYDVCRSRFGRDEADRRFRAVMHSPADLQPLDRVEIDHTPINAVLVDENGMTLGRPYLTACIDVASRCILGIHIGFEPPSYRTVAHCLKHAILPKPETPPDPRIRSAWEPYGLMKTLVVDNGLEFHSSSLENACYTLGISIEYSPRKRAWFKPHIERWLGTVNRESSHTLPGSTFENSQTRGDYSSAEHATIRLAVFRVLVEKWIVDVYHARRHAGLGTAPIQAWKGTIDHADIRLPKDPRIFDAIMGRSERRILTHKGIELDGLFYNSPELADLRLKYGEVLDVEVRVNDADIGHVSVIAPGDRRVIAAKALKFEYANGLSRWQHKVCKRFARRHLPPEVGAPEEAKKQIDEIIRQELSAGRRIGKRGARWVGNGSGRVSVTPGVAEDLPSSTQGSSRPTPPEVPATAPATRKSFAPVRKASATYVQEFEKMSLQSACETG